MMLQILFSKFNLECTTIYYTILLIYYTIIFIIQFSTVSALYLFVL